MKRIITKAAVAIAIALATGTAAVCADTLQQDEATTKTASQSGKEGPITNAETGTKHVVKKTWNGTRNVARGTVRESKRIAHSTMNESRRIAQGTVRESKRIAHGTMNESRRFAATARSKAHEGIAMGGTAKNKSEGFAAKTWDETRKVTRTVVDSPVIAWQAMRGERPLFPPKNSANEESNQQMALSGHRNNTNSRNGTNVPPI